MKRSVELSGVEQTPGLSNGEIRAELRGIAQATDDLLQALESSGFPQELQQSSTYNLHTLDKRLPKRTVYDLLLACETFASVTAPALLSAGKVGDLYTQANPLLQTVRHIERVTRGQSFAGGSGTTLHMQGLLLRSAFAAPQSQAALERLVESMTAAISGGGEQTAGRRFELRIGTRFLVPGSVLAITVGLIIFFLSGVAFATGAVTVSQNGVGFNALQNSMATQTAAASNSAANSTATASGQGGAASGKSATPTRTSNGNPTATPSGSTSTPTPNPASTPTLSASPAVIQPCIGTDAQFTLSYTGGSNAITWHANSPEPANIALSLDGTNFTSSVSGTLQPGASVTVYVRLLNDPTNPIGDIAVSGSNGIKTSSVRYDMSGC